METVDKASVVPVKPGAFVSGDPRANVSGRPKKVKRPYEAPADDGAPPALMDMRHVYLNQKEHDKTAGQDMMRELHKKDPKGFLSQMAAMEKEHRAAIREAEKRDAERVVGSGVSLGGTPDMGTGECLGLVEKLIGELVKSGG
jgi:hypothetical protein